MTPPPPIHIITYKLLQCQVHFCVEVNIMAETLRELVVALPLDSSNFLRSMPSINQQIKEAV